VGLYAFFCSKLFFALPWEGEGRRLPQARKRPSAMGKKQHSKDKMYVLQSEWQYEGMSGGRGYAGGKGNAHKLPFRCLPFHCCALSLSPFQDPMMTPKVQIRKSKRSTVAL
jgi:hypothetical protein